MSKYLITFEKQNATALCEYNELGYLVRYELTPGAFEDKQFEYLAQKFPRKLVHIEQWKQAKLPNVTIRIAEEDLSFERFYDLYAHKVSKRSRAENIWKAMPNTERAKALAYIAKYERYLLDSGVNKKYPETYLNAQLWNN